MRLVEDVSLVLASLDVARTLRFVTDPNLDFEKYIKLYWFVLLTLFYGDIETKINLTFGNVIVIAAVKSELL